MIANLFQLTRRLLGHVCSICPSSWTYLVTLTWISCFSYGPSIVTSSTAFSRGNGTSSAIADSVPLIESACFVSDPVTYRFIKKLSWEQRSRCRKNIALCSAAGHSENFSSSFRTQKNGRPRRTQVHVTSALQWEG